MQSKHCPRSWLWSAHFRCWMPGTRCVSHVDHGPCLSKRHTCQCACVLGTQGALHLSVSAVSRPHSAYMQPFPYSHRHDEYMGLAPSSLKHAPVQTPLARHVDVIYTPDTPPHACAVCLSHNQMSEVSEELVGLTGLRSLDLSNNRLARLPER